eukprot:Opistho-1_new@31645
MGQARQVLVEEFQKTQESLLPVTHNAVKSTALAQAAKVSVPATPVARSVPETPASSAPAGSEGAQSERRESLVASLDKSAIAAQRKEEEKLVVAAVLDKPKEVEKDRQLPAFWLPSLTPEAKASMPQPPSKVTVCAATKHPLKLKQLFSIKFTPTPGGPMDPRAKPTGAGGSSAAERWICPSCVKSLTNNPKIAAVRTCGHVLCSVCADKFCKATGSCQACGVKCAATDIVPIFTEGTGFAGHGDTLVAKKYTAAFQA